MKKQVQVPADRPFPLRRRLSRRLLRAAKPDPQAEPIALGELIEGLGDRSFGWCLLLFALLNLIPLPLGSNMVTAIPLLLIAAQMALGYHHLRLPRFITARRVDRRAFRRTVMRLHPLIAPIEKIIRPRHELVFAPAYARPMAILLFAVAFNLFLPIPLSGYLPAGALFVTAFGVIERDGLVTLAGLALGIFSIVVSLTIIVLLFLGAEALRQP